MEDCKDDHHEPHRFLQEAHPRPGRQVPGHGPEDLRELWVCPSFLPARHFTRLGHLNTTTHPPSGNVMGVPEPSHTSHPKGEWVSECFPATVPTRPTVLIGVRWRACEGTGILPPPTAVDVEKDAMG
jgi:hypothetical protein